MSSHKILEQYLDQNDTNKVIEYFFNKLRINNVSHLQAEKYVKIILKNKNYGLLYLFLEKYYSELRIDKFNIMKYFINEKNFKELIKFNNIASIKTEFLISLWENFKNINLFKLYIDGDLSNFIKYILDNKIIELMEFYFNNIHFNKYLFNYLTFTNEISFYITYYNKKFSENIGIINKKNNFYYKIKNDINLLTKAYEKNMFKNDLFILDVNENILLFFVKNKLLSVDQDIIKLILQTNKLNIIETALQNGYLLLDDISFSFKGNSSKLYFKTIELIIKYGYIVKEIDICTCINVDFEIFYFLLFNFKILTLPFKKYNYDKIIFFTETDFRYLELLLDLGCIDSEILFNIADKNYNTTNIYKRYINHLNKKLDYVNQYIKI